MAKNIDALSKQLQELSKTINSFKSEAVQLKIVDKLLGGLSISDVPVSSVKEVKTKITEVKPKIQAKTKAKVKPKVVAKADKKVEVKAVPAKEIKKPEVKAVSKQKVKVAKKAVAKKAPVKKIIAAAKPAVAKIAKAKISKVAKPQAKVKKVVKDAKVKKENGPTSTINLLFEKGYFAQKRNMGEVVKYINNDLKLPYKITALSGLVNKLVKDKKIVRAINPENKKYEYVNA